jgi:hypothetical protein
MMTDFDHNDRVSDAVVVVVKNEGASESSFTVPEQGVSPNKVNPVRQTAVQMPDMRTAENVQMPHDMGTGVTERPAQFVAGDQIYVIVGPTNVRQAPNGTSIVRVQAGMSGTIVGGPETSGPDTWWQVKYASGVQGWSAAPFLRKLR